jgi:hypothetical protein
MASALGQSLQTPGVSGMENNTILFEFGLHDPGAVVEEGLGGLRLGSASKMNRLILRHGENFFGSRRNIHVWLTWHDAKNANLMILLSYILLGHRDWREAEISIFAAYPRSEVRERSEELHEMIADGRLLISEKNVRVIPTDGGIDFERLVQVRSGSADLVLHGFTEERLERRGAELLTRFPELRDVLFVSAEEEIFIE